MLLLQKGDSEKALHTAKRGENFSSQNKLYLQQARFCGLLSSQYRLLRLFDFGEVYLKKGIEASKLIKDDQERYKFLGSILLEAASYKMDTEQYTEAIKEIKRATIEFKKVELEEYKKFYLTNVSNLKGSAYIGLEEYQKAIDQYKLAIGYSSNFKNTNIPLKAQIVSGLGRSFLMLDCLDSAFVYLELTREIAEMAQFAHLQIEVYPALAKYYQRLGDYENYTLYNEKFLAVYNQQSEEEDGSIDTLVEEISKTQESSKFDVWLIIALICLIILFIFIGIWYRNIKIKELDRFNSALNNIEEQKKLNLGDSNLNISKTDCENLSEKDKKTLLLLEEHSQKESFTKDCNSLSTIAEKFGVSKDYLNNLVKTHRGTDFESYINKSMIFCFLDKIETNPEFRKYRLVVLAEEAGFQSKNQFIQTFEFITGFIPSKYLNLWRANEKRKNSSK